MRIIPPVLDKRDMYRRLSAGEFGNTTPQYFSLDEWWKRPQTEYKYDYWGIRSFIPGGKFSANVSVYDLSNHVRHHYAEGEYNISVIIDQVVKVTAWLQVMRDTEGLLVEAVHRADQFIAAGQNWRSAFPKYHKAHRRTEARGVLEHYLNPNSLDDLNLLLDVYPDHVIELSACASNFGTIEGRNGVIWEVRRY